MLGRIAALSRALFLSFAFFAFLPIFQVVNASTALDTIKYTYDDLGRLTGVEYVETRVFYTFVYDKSGNRTSYQVSGNPAVARLWNSRILEGGVLKMGVWLTQPGLTGVSVDWRVVTNPDNPRADYNPATLGEDYTLASGTVEFPDGAQEVHLRIPTIDDTELEPYEHIYVELTNPLGIELDSDPDRVLRVGTIRDNDGVYFNVEDVDVTEGGLATLVINREGPLDSAVTVQVEAIDFTATGGADYDTVIYGANNQPLAGSELTFAVGETAKTILVQTHADDMYELDEEFYVDFKWTSDGFPGWERSKIAVVNDDPYPEVSIGNSGNKEGRNIRFAIWLNNPSYEPVTLTLEASSNGSNSEGYPNATVLDDYTPEGAYVTGGVNASSISGSTVTYVIAPGETNASLYVPTVADSTQEDIFEAFYAAITSASNASVNPAQSVGRGRIRDDDQDVTMTASAGSVAEGNGAANTLTIPLTLSAAGKGHPATTVDWTVVGGTAVHGVDFTGPTSGTAEIPFGETSGSITFQTVPNTVYSSDKTVIVQLSNWTDSSYIGDVDITSTITEDDTQPAYIQASAGNDFESVANRQFTITRSGNTAVAASVNYVIAGTTAVLDEDFVAASGTPLSGTVSFSAGQTSKSLSITVLDDNIWEQRDDVKVTLSNPSAGAVITDATATLGIGNEDGEPIINIFSKSVPEQEGNRVVQFKVFLQGGTIKPVTVVVRTNGGTATPGQDYQQVSSYEISVSGGGEDRFLGYVPVTIYGDTTYEPDETFGLEVVSYTNARTVTSGINDENPDKGSNGVITILNDDYSYSLSYGSWGSWSSCTGQSTHSRSRSATCTRDQDGASVALSYCGGATTSQSQSCSYGWNYGSWSNWGACQSNNTQTRTRSATCKSSTGHTVSGSKCGTATTTDTRTCSYYSYAWNTGSWSSYSACTGQANRVRTRSVTCKRSPGGATVSDSYCDGGKPATSETGAACSYSWSYSSWSGWPACTGQTTRYNTRTATCTSSTGNTVSNSKCSGTPDTSRQDTCTYAWNTGSWSSWTCVGIGTATWRSRDVTCRSESGQTVSDSYCSGTKPVDQQHDTDPACDSGGWGGGF